MIKLVIFDAGDILYRVPPKEIVDNIVSGFLKRHGYIDYEQADRIWEELAGKAIVGEISAADANILWLKKLGLNKDLISKLSKIIREEILKKHGKAFPRVNETLQKLKTRYKLAVLSDAIVSKEERIEEFKILGIDWTLFDEIFTSHDIKYVKPNKEAYLTVLRYFNVRPTEAVFVGHDSDEIDGARALGMKTISLINKTTNADYFVEQFHDILRIIIDFLEYV